jgi:hypothetical protein
MHVRMYHPALRMNRHMHLPYERTRIHDVGLGGLDGINIGKMFNRMFTFKPSSFKFKNIMGAVGSGFTNFMTLGAASAFAPKTFSAHSTAMKQVGMGVSAAAAAAVGVTAGASLGPGLWTAAKTAGSALYTGVKTVGSGIQNFGSSLFGGGGSSSGSSGSSSGSGGSSGGWLDTAGRVLETGAKVMAATQAPSAGMIMGGGMYDPSSGVYIVPQPIVTGVAQQVPQAWYPQAENQPLMYAGQAGAGQPGTAGGYYNPSGGPVDEGVIRNPDGTIDSSTIISGVADKHVYIGGGVLALGLLYAFS